MNYAFSDELLHIVAAIRHHGGRALLVGGAVRDLLGNIPPKDQDIEVYSLPAIKVVQILANYGSVDQVGMSFGVIKLRSSVTGKEYDFSLPRRESKSGSGHRGFIVEADSEMTPQEASSRRDFTINAMAFDFETGQILDFYGGQEDMRAGILRHTSPAFSEDPLRVLRGFQFVSRFNLQAAPETVALCHQLKTEYHTLPKERLWGEWYKWAKSSNPSAGLEFLAETGWIKHFPMLEGMIGVPQNPLYHPEGTVWNHALLVSEAAARIAKRDSLDEFSTVLAVLTGLCHDLGKPATTILEDGVWKSPGHAEAGEEPSLIFLNQIGAPLNLIEKAVPLVSEHLAYLQVTSSRNVRRLASRLGPATIHELLWIIEADHAGRPPLSPELPEQARVMMAIAQETNTTQGKQLPILMGKHLIAAGIMSPGKKMGELLKSAYEAQMDGLISDVDDGLRFAQKYLAGQNETNQ